VNFVVAKYFFSGPTGHLNIFLPKKTHPLRFVFLSQKFSWHFHQHSKLSLIGGLQPFPRDSNNKDLGGHVG